MPIWKPGTRKGAVYLTPDAGSAPVITLGGGKQIRLVRGDQAGGSFFNEGNYQWVVPRESYGEVVGSSDFKISHNGQEGVIGSGASSYRGNSLSNWQASTKGAVGSAGAGGGGFGAFSPTTVGDFGVVPADISGMYPTPALVDYQPADKTKLKFTDPAKFAADYAKANAGQILKNRISARDTALEQLDTELKGLQGYVPGSAALARNETSVDNIFNSQQRARAVQAALPEAAGDLAGQRKRALSFASGKVPDEITDRAFELNSRSASADQSAAGGFGQSSSVSRKVSDLESADARIKLSQYGDQLLTGNLGTKANLFLPPTEYSSAGSQVRIMPEVGGARLSANELATENSLTTIAPGQALSDTIQQNEFQAGNDQQTTLFNAGNQFSANQINAAATNQFALGLFNYLAGFAGAAAQGTQNNINTTTALDQQQQALDAFQKSQGQTQNANTVGAAAQGVASVLTAGAGLISTLSPNNSTTTTTTTQNPGSGGQVPGLAPSGNNFVPLDTSSASGVNTPSVDTSGASGVNTPSVDTSGGGDISGGSVQSMPGGDGGASIVPYSAHVTPSSVSYATKAIGELPVGQNLNESVTKQLLSSQAPHLEQLGIHDSPQPGAVRQLNSAGSPVYVTPGPPAVANNTNVGAGFINTVHAALDPTGVFSKEDSTTLQKVGVAASDAAFLAQLTTLSSKGDQAGFIKAIGMRVAPAIIASSGASDQNKAGLNAAANAANIFTNWQNMTPAQRSLAVAQVGIQGFKFATGENLNTKVIPGTQIGNGPSLTVGAAMNLAAQGYNIYGLTKNWGQLNNFQRATYGASTAINIAATAQKFGMLGVGSTNAAVAANAPELVSSGYSSVAAYGVGALQGPSAAATPAGYSVVNAGANAGTKVIVPTPNIEGAGTLSYIPQIAGAASVAAGAYTIYQGWGKNRGGWQGPVQGALGGAAIASGLSALGLGLGPVGFGAIIVGGALADSWGKTGKSDQQLARDSVRDIFVEKGLTDKRGTLTLADGSTATIGADGSSDLRDWKNPALAGEAGKRQLHAYDNDFTNPLDFFAGQQGTALTRILTGVKADNVDQIGRQLGNASLGNVGFGKDLSEANFNTARDNMRLFYAKSGVMSKDQAYALANQAYGEGRINDTDLISMHQMYNMVFDKDGFTTANKLAQGHAQGVKAAQPPATKDERQMPKQTDAQRVGDALANPGKKVDLTGIKITPLSLKLRNKQIQQLAA